MALLLSVLVIQPVSAGTVNGYFIPGGMYGGHSGYYAWVDYCPLCHHSNCLEVNPKGTYEGEITCSICDADYDGVTGYDKYEGGARAELIPYEEPEVEPVQNSTPTPAPVVELSPLDKAKQLVQTASIF